jgi:hypothetical protein
MKSYSAEENNENNVEDHDNIEPDPQSLISPRYFEPNQLLENTERN